MNVKILEPKPPITKSEITRVESKFNIKLPQEYVDFLLKYNGGYPEPNRFKYESNKEHYSDSLVNWFYSIYEGEYNNFEPNILNWSLHGRRFPDGIIPIAGDPFGNIICIGIADGYMGKVYFWDHEEESDTDIPHWDNVYLIANSFNQFLELLH